MGAGGGETFFLSLGVFGLQNVPQMMNGMLEGKM